MTRKRNNQPTNQTKLINLFDINHLFAQSETVSRIAHTNSFTQLNGPKYCYVIPIIQFLYLVKWFHVFLWNTIQLIILCLLTVKWLNSSIWPIDGSQTGATTPGQSWPGSNVMFPKASGLKPHHPIQDICERDALPLYWNVVSVFYSSSRLDCFT